LAPTFLLKKLLKQFLKKINNWTTLFWYHDKRFPNPFKCDETLASFIKESTQQKGKGKTKREDPSLSQKCKVFKLFLNITNIPCLN
jgi:hypothetical protein